MEVDGTGSSGGALCETWYVAQTKRHRERVAVAILGRRFETYLPLIREEPPPVVGSTIAPMFPCYVFVRANLFEAYQQISRTPGVKDFVRIAGAPGTVSEEAIDFLRGNEGPDGVVRRRSQLQPGSSIEIVRGAFRGLEGVIEDVRSGERVRLLLALFHRQARVEVPYSWIRER